MNTNTQTMQLKAGDRSWVILRLVAGTVAFTLLVFANAIIPNVTRIAPVIFTALIALSVWQYYQGRLQKAAHYVLLAIGMAKALVFAMLFTSIELATTGVPYYGIAASFLVVGVYAGSVWACAEWRRVEMLYAILVAELLFVLSPLYFYQVGG